jgi:iron complex outermembrane receptor protein
MDYTLGGFYFDENSIYGTHQDLWYAAGPGNLDFLGQDPIPAHDKAGFLHTVWHLFDRFDLTAGVRYTSQDKDYTYTRVNTTGGTGGGAALVGSLNGVTGTYAANRWDYRGNLSYRFTDDFMGYAQVSTGFKGGGVNPRPFFPFQAIKFNPETVTSYEVGIKTSWFDHKLRFNLDGYYSKYKDIQLALLNCSFLNPPGFPIPPALTPCALPFNAGDADIKGVELEIASHPFAGFEIDLSGSYLDFKYTSLSSYPTGVTLGMTTPYTPKYQGSAGIEYHFDLGGAGSITPRLDASARSEIYTNAVNGPNNRVAGYTLYNARIVWKPAKDDWQVALEALNLGNKLYYLNVFDLSAVGAGSVAGTPGQPFQIAVEVKHTM